MTVELLGLSSSVSFDPCENQIDSDNFGNFRLCRTFEVQHEKGSIYPRVPPSVHARWVSGPIHTFGTILCWLF